MLASSELSEDATCDKAAEASVGATVAPVALRAGVTSETAADAALETSDAIEETRLFTSCVADKVADGTESRGAVPVDAYVVVAGLKIPVVMVSVLEPLLVGVVEGSRVGRRPPKRPPSVVELEVDQVERPTMMASLEEDESPGRASDGVEVLDPAVGDTLSVTDPADGLK